MKRALNILLVYILLLIIGIASVTFLYSIYINVLNYIAGEPVVFFANDNLIKSLIYSSYCVLILICPIISYYKIRHPGGIPQMLGFIFVALLTWAVLVPGLTHVEKYITIRTSAKETHLSKDYFRRVDKKVYYFTKDFESVNNNVATSSAIIIDTDDKGKVEYKTVRDLKSMDFNKKSEPFNDILVKQNFDNSRITLPVSFNKLIERIKKSYNFELMYLWYFISLALVICSVYALSNIFNWKLINAVLIFFLTVSIISANSIDSGSLFASVKDFFMELKPFVYLSDYIYESFLFTFNLLCSLVFIILGIVKFAVSKRKKQD